MASVSLCDQLPRVELFYTGPVVNAGMLVMMLEKLNGVHPRPLALASLIELSGRLSFSRAVIHPTSPDLFINWVLNSASWLS